MKTNGYDGVIISYDVGSFGRETDTYIALNSSQVKSADPVTYDDNGDIIPLSERFNESEEDIRYSIRDSAEGFKYVEVEDDILINDGKTLAQTLSDIISSKFNNLIVNGQQIKANRFTNKEWRQSKYSKYLYSNNREKYENKMRAFNNADELVKAAKNWINEKAKHKNYSQFARGYVYFKYLGNGYSADVVVGISNNGAATLYDLVNIQDKKITELPLQRREENSLYRNGNSVDVMDITTLPDESQVSKSTKDSNGKELTKEQQEYFKNSKVRDENGNLLVVYHGTDADFTVFDILKAGKNGRAEGYGFYFTDDKTISNKYGNNQITSYLNITKPLYDDRVTLKKGEYEKFVSAVIDYEINREEIEWQDSFISNYVYTYDYGSKSACIKDFVNDIWQSNKNDQDLIYEIANGAGLNYDVESIKEFYDILYNAIGVDGNISTWEQKDGKSTIYVAFSPEQIKFVSNTNPTTSDDIRFSTKDNPSDVAIYFDKVRKENKALQNILATMEEQFTSVRNVNNIQQKELKQEDIDNVAKRLLRENRSKYVF